jgi:hypothetical protein
MSVDVITAGFPTVLLVVVSPDTAPVIEAVVFCPCSGERKVAEIVVVSPIQSTSVSQTSAELMIGGRLFPEPLLQASK